MDNKTDKLLTDTEVCELLRISVVTLRTHLRSGEKNGIKSIRHIMVGGQRRWVRASVEKFINGK